MNFSRCFERSFGGLLPITIHQFLIGPDLNPHHHRLVGSAEREGDDDLSAAISRCIEGLQQRRIFTYRSANIQIGEHGRAVDGYIEFTISGGAEISFGKVQRHGVSTTGRQPRNSVGEVSSSPVLIYRHRRCVDSGLGQIDGGGDRTVIPAAAEVLIGNEGVIAAAGVALGRTRPRRWRRLQNCRLQLVW
jgi:hypothetical protein